MPRHQTHRNDNNQATLDNFARGIGLGVVDVSQTDIPGMPDRIYLDRGRTFWCETKSDTAYGKKGLSESQMMFRSFLAAHGIRLHVIRSHDDLLKLKNGGNE